MRYLIIKLLIVLITVQNIGFSQSLISGISQFEGKWLFVPPKNSGDTSFTAIDIFKRNMRLKLFFWHNPAEISVRERLIGFAPKGKKIQRLSDLASEGQRMHFYTPNPSAPNDSIHYFQEASPSCLALFNGIAGEEEMAPPEDGEPNYFTFNFNGRENEYHIQIHHLPNRVVQALHKNPVEKSKVEDFLGIHYACIKPTTVLINKQPHQPTKIYLIQNDPVEVVEERDDWLKIKYYPEKNGEWTGKTIEGWIEKTDVE